MINPFMLSLTMKEIPGIVKINENFLPKTLVNETSRSDGSDYLQFA